MTNRPNDTLTLTAVAERILFRLAEVDHLHLSHRPPHTAKGRLIARMNEEIADATIYSPNRTDQLAMECHTYADLARRAHGPRLMLMLEDIALRALPERVF